MIHLSVRFSGLSTKKKKASRSPGTPEGLNGQELPSTYIWGSQSDGYKRKEKNALELEEDTGTANARMNHRMCQL